MRVSNGYNSLIHSQCQTSHTLIGVDKITLFIDIVIKCIKINVVIYHDNFLKLHDVMFFPYGPTPAFKLLGGS